MIVSNIIVCTIIDMEHIIIVKVINNKNIYRYIDK